MSTCTIEKVKGYCPEIDDQKIIDVTFKNINASGKLYDKIKNNFICDKKMLNSCEYIKKNGNCPIYQEIKNLNSK